MVYTFIYDAVSSYLQLKTRLKQLSVTSAARFRVFQDRSEAFKVLDWSSGRLKTAAGQLAARGSYPSFVR